MKHFTQLRKEILEILDKGNLILDSEQEVTIIASQRVDVTELISAEVLRYCETLAAPYLGLELRVFVDSYDNNPKSLFKVAVENEHYTEWMKLRKSKWEQVAEFAIPVNKAQNVLDPIKFPLIERTKLDPTFLAQMVKDEYEEQLEATDYEEYIDSIVDMLYYILDSAIKVGFEQQAVEPIENVSMRELPSMIAGLCELTLESQEYVLNQIVSYLENWCHDVTKAFAIVHSANMAKLEGGVLLDEDPTSKRYGKVLKPTGWKSPSFKEILACQ